MQNHKDLFNRENLTVVFIFLTLLAVCFHYSAGLSATNKIRMVFIFIFFLLPAFSSIAFAFIVDNGLPLIRRGCVGARGIGLFLFAYGTLIPLFRATFSWWYLASLLAAGSVLWFGSLFVEQRHLCRHQ